MPYALRAADGTIKALFQSAEGEAQEYLPQGSPEVQAFLGLAADTAALGDLDQDLIRVLEDLIDVLIHKNLLRITDLPPEAQSKLLTRKRVRNQLYPPSMVLGPDDGVL
ncbi:hypothetical protein SAMN02745857_00453 [Andreprevotia lacus DSM 23236]|jgi:hypothetical protein|uniref:Tryptophan synthase subunit beta like protein n=1 Tax=Andreprevotia lacus DSM 23236 TaxID=1121001 RepID=A0A1W1X2S6_9NEIS|nr:hypothetical protein [Andreprevotia lacus]SMC18028.1 hypothetical protein SAMN02745857_00453 [Andreprevotia lacus DSM 23236]